MGFLDDIAGFFSDVVNVVMTPFKEMSKMFTGMVTDQARTGIDLIEQAGDELGLDTVANKIIDGVGAIGGEGLDLIDGAGDSIFGAMDIMKYLPYVALGFIGLFGLKYGSEMISEGGRSYSTVRGMGRGRR